MSTPDWRVRAARRKDRALLGAIACANPKVSWEVEVERFIRNELFSWAFDPFARRSDPRVVLLFHRQTGELVGVAAHERTELRYGKQKSFSATKLEVVAIALNWRGREFKGGERAVDVLLSAVMTDVAERVPPRHARVFEFSRVDGSYRRLVTRHHR